MGMLYSIRVIRLLFLRFLGITISRVTVMPRNAHLRLRDVREGEQVPGGTGAGQLR
jgi:hypothetical protein